MGEFFKEGWGVEGEFDFKEYQRDQALRLKNGRKFLKKHIKENLKYFCENCVFGGCATRDLVLRMYDNSDFSGASRHLDHCIEEVKKERWLAKNPNKDADDYLWEVFMKG